MAKIKSLFRITGTLAGVTFYTAEGQTIARTQTSLNKKRVMNDPAFARSREAMSEFGGASALAKTLRSIWLPFRKRAADPRINGRLTATLQGTLKNAPGIRGQRSFILRDHPGKLIGFRLRKDHWTASSLASPPRVTVSADRDRLDFEFPAGIHLKAGQGATHFRLLLAIGLVSDFLFDTQLKAYRPADPELHGAAAQLESPTFPVAGQTLPAFSLALPGGSAAGATETLVGLYGIEFMQEVNGKFEPLRDGAIMEICFVG